MGRPLRIVVRQYGDLFEVTTRCLQGRMLLRPSAEVNEIVLGVLGRALWLYPGVRLVAPVFMSNHYSLLLRPSNAEVMSKFVDHVNSNVARKVGRLHGWSEKFWGRRYRSIQVVDGVSGEERLRYLLAHGAKEGLVDRPGQWPGVNAHEALLEGKPLQGTWFDWTASYPKRRRGKTVDPYDYATVYPVPLAPLPEWDGLTEQERRERCAAMVADIEREVQEVNRTKGRVSPGSEFVLAQNPHDRPQKIKKSPAPICHASSGALITAFRLALAAFVDAYRAAAAALKAGHPEEADFPPGCFPPHLPFVRDPSAATEPPRRPAPAAAMAP